MNGSKRGFTLIELLVVCAIIIVITALVLVNNSKFGGEVTLENLAYGVALSVRQAQVYGIAVEQFGNSFSSGYGMNFSLSSPQQYVLFADLEGTGIYDPAYLTKYPNEAGAYPQGEIEELNTIQQGYAITGICVIPDSGSGSCDSVSEVDILYVRPEPEAYISASENGTPPSCVENQAVNCNYEAQITLTAPDLSTSTVVIDATGQISVQ